MNQETEPEKVNIPLNNKNNKGLIITIIIISLLIIASLVSYIFTDGFKNVRWFEEKEKASAEKETKNKIEDDDKVINGKISTDEKNQLIALLNNNLGQFLIPFEDVNKIKNQDKLLFALEKVAGENIYSSEHNFKASDLLKVLREYFGESITVINENIKCQATFDKTPIYLYDSNKDVYSYNEEHRGHGFSFIVRSPIYYIDGYVKNAKYIINTNEIFSSWSEMPSYDYYDDVYLTGKILPTKVIDNEELVLIGENAMLAYINSVYENNKDKMKVYEYTFTKTATGFTLDSYVLKK